MNAQQTINSLEEERQALYALGNGPDVDTYKRREQLLTIAARLESAFAEKRGELAGRNKEDDRAWEQAR